MPMIASTLPRIALAIVLASALSAAAAQDVSKDAPKDRPNAAERHETGKGILRLLPADAVTEHSIDTPRGKVSYTATAGTLAFYDQSGDQSASVFYTAYVAKNAAPNRPLTFVFNGGPGAASAFLHLGLVGPRILDFGPGNYDASRANLRDNPDTWLGFTDLVLIDPIGTGWSRAIKGDDAKHFWSVRSDADAMAKAIALYVAKNDRSASPKYLFGESYGGLRAAKVGRVLQTDQGIAVAGIVMLSPLLEGWLTFGDDTSALHAALQLPSLAAAELERKHAFTPRRARRGGKVRDDGLSGDARGAYSEGRCGQRVLRTRRPADRITARRGDTGARICSQRLRENVAGVRQQNRQPL